MDYVRGTSAVLFSAILAAAAKFYRKDLYAVLLAHTQQLLNRALAESFYDISLVQAIGILVYWRETTDKSAFVKIGMAIRICYQLGLHFSQDSALTDDGTVDVLGRLKRKVRQTWSCPAGRQFDVQCESAGAQADMAS